MGAESAAGDTEFQDIRISLHRKGNMLGNLLRGLALSPARRCVLSGFLRVLADEGFVDTCAPDID